MNHPINPETDLKTMQDSNAVLSFLNSSLQDLETKMRIPQAPAELEQTKKMCNAINSAIEIVNRTQMTTLTEQG